MRNKRKKEEWKKKLFEKRKNLSTCYGHTSHVYQFIEKDMNM